MKMPSFFRFIRERKQERGEKGKPMKPFRRLMALALWLSLCCTPALADYVSVETPVFSAQLECIASLNEDEEYRLLDPPEQGLPEDDDWLKTYQMAYVTFYDKGEKTKIRGWIVTGYLPQPLGRKPRLTQGGSLLEAQGAENTLYFEGLKARDPSFDDPQPGDMALEKALSIAIENMEYAYGETDATLARFRTVEYGIVHEQEYMSVPYWQFFFRSPINKLDTYQVNVRATDGAILVLCGPGEGDG